RRREGCQACRYATRQDRRGSTGSSLAICALRLKESRFRQARGTRSRLREAPLAENESEWPAKYPRDIWQAAPADDGPPTAAQVPPTTPYVPPATPYGPPAAPYVPPAVSQVPPPAPYVP